MELSRAKGCQNKSGIAGWYLFGFLNLSSTTLRMLIRLVHSRSSIIDSFPQTRSGAVWLKCPITQVVMMISYCQATNRGHTDTGRAWHSNHPITNFVVDNVYSFHKIASINWIIIFTYSAQYRVNHRDSTWFNVITALSYYIVNWQFLHFDSIPLMA